MSTNSKLKKAAQKSSTDNSNVGATETTATNSIPNGDDAVAVSNYETSNDASRRSYSHSRRVAIAMWLHTLPDGKTTRIQQVLDFAIPFASHPELVETMNNMRRTIFGEELATVFNTGRMEIPNSDTIVVHVLVMDSNTGELKKHLPFSCAEAKEYMENIRAQARRRGEERAASRKNSTGYRSDSDEFGTSMQEAMATAANSKNTGETGGSAAAAANA